AAVPPGGAGAARGADRRHGHPALLPARAAARAARRRLRAGRGVGGARPGAAGPRDRCGRARRGGGGGRRAAAGAAGATRRHTGARGQPARRRPGRLGALRRAGARRRRRRRRRRRDREQLRRGGRARPVRQRWRAGRQRAQRARRAHRAAAGRRRRRGRRRPVRLDAALLRALRGPRPPRQRARCRQRGARGAGRGVPRPARAVGHALAAPAPPRLRDVARRPGETFVTVTAGQPKMCRATSVVGRSVVGGMITAPETTETTEASSRPEAAPRPARRAPDPSRAVDWRRLRRPAAFAPLLALTEVAIGQVFGTAGAVRLAEDPTTAGLVLLALCVVGGAALDGLGQVIWAGVVDRAEGRLRSDLLSAALRQPLAVLSEQAVGEILDRVDDDTHAVGTLVRRQLWGAGRTLVATVPMWVLAGLTWWPAWVLFPVLGVLVWATTRRMLAEIARRKVV